MIIFADSSDPICNSSDPNRVPKTPWKNPDIDMCKFESSQKIKAELIRLIHQKLAANLKLLIVKFWSSNKVKNFFVYYEK